MSPRPTRPNSTSTTGRKNLKKEEWYHGLLPREDITTLLVKQGQFLVRQTEPKAGQGKKTVVSVRWNQRLHHLIINESEGFFYTEHTKFSSVSDLIAHYLRTGKPVTEKSGALLLTPVLKQEWELKHEQLELGKLLGEGAFGGVYSGTFTTTSKKKLTVAVKVYKGTNLSKDIIKDMCKEARIMRRYEHPVNRRELRLVTSEFQNIVHFYGLAIEKEPLMIVMELVDGGALDDYLQKHGAAVTLQEKLDCMSMGTVWGLEYLHSKNCIHRDVAARNCLYAKKTVRISDFGLSREGSSYQMTSAKRLPIKWLAPETLTTGIYTPKSDVFSLGILIWEVFANGAEPFRGMTNAEVQKQVLDGYRMELAPETPEDLVELITKRCWDANPETRWTISQVAREFERITGCKPPKQNLAKERRGRGETTAETTVDEKTREVEQTKEETQVKPRTRSTKRSGRKGGR